MLDKKEKYWKGRAIWCVQFSPCDKIVASGHNNGSIRIWSLDDYECIKVLQGHDSSVLNIQFVNQGWIVFFCFFFF